MHSTEKSDIVKSFTMLQKIVFQINAVLMNFLFIK